MNQAITPEDLAAILKREHDNAQSYADSLRDIVQTAFEYYEARPFGNELEGRSQIVLPDVQETVDYMTQSVLRVFISGDRVVEFEATDESDEQSTDDATAAIEYRFMREQDGYGVLNDIAFDGNLRKIGIFKAVAITEEKVSRQWEVIPLEALPIIEASEDIEDVREFEEMDPETGQPVAMARVLIKREQQETRYNLVAVPMEEFRFSPDARHEDEADYVSHAKPVTRSELVSMGFEREQVYSLPAYSDDLGRQAQSALLDQYNDDDSSAALERVLFCEDYARVDVDGDGIAELVKVCRVENEILRYQGEPVIDPMTGEQAADEYGDPLFEEGELAVETVDEQPFAVFCPFPRPHRLVGYSLADKVMDIQYARSHIARQLFDGMAFANMPRHEVVEGGSTDDTLDDLLNPIPGSPVRVKAQGTITPLTNSFDVGKSLSVMEWMTGERESRTGITRMNQGLDADTLNKTATGTALMQAQGQQFEEYVARNLAEAFARGCAKLYRLMRLEAEPFKIKVDGQYRMVDPSEWPESVNMRVRVGLGTGNRDKRIQARMALLGPMTQAIENGLAGPEHAFAWMDGMARDTMIGKGEDFMFDPADPEVAQRMAQESEQPDPELVKVQEEMGLKREQAQFDAEMRAFESERKMELEAAKISGNLDLQAFKAETEARLAMMKADLEARLKVDMSQNRSGGRLDA